jgi:hypothetical protein
MVEHVCNPSYMKGIGGRISVGGWPWGKSARPYLKISKAKKDWGHGSYGGNPHGVRPLVQASVPSKKINKQTKKEHLVCFTLSVCSAPGTQRHTAHGIGGWVVSLLF